MSSSDSVFRRVAVYADAVHVDLALPAAVPVAALLPAVVDSLAGNGADFGDWPVGPYRLSCPGIGELDGPSTLAQHHIRDGTVLTVTATVPAAPPPGCDDVAEVVAATGRRLAGSWTPRAARLAGVIAASWLAAVAGVVAVPGDPGAPQVLLAGSAVATIASLAGPLIDTGAVVVTAVSGSAALTAFAALAVLITGAPVRIVGAVGAVAVLCLLQAAARLADATAGLSRAALAGDVSGAEQNAIRGQRRLTGLIVACSAFAAGGAVCAMVGGRGDHSWPAGAGFGAAVGIALLLRARSAAGLTRSAALLSGGIVDLGVVVVVFAPHRGWAGVIVGLAALAALGLGFVPPAAEWPHGVRRGAEWAEYLTLGAVVPLACWLCGCYDFVRVVSR